MGLQRSTEMAPIRVLTLATLRSATLAAILGAAVACSDDPAPDPVGVGADCVQDRHCDEGQQCLDEYNGGYCSVPDCASDADCPEDSGCASYQGNQLCIRICVSSTTCNQRRGDAQALCSDDIEFVKDADTRKGCRPPLK